MQTQQITVPAVWADLLLRLVDTATRPAAPPPPPPPPPPRAVYPPPADFAEETLIAHLAGVPVYGLAYWNEDEGREARYDVRCTIGDTAYHTDGESIIPSDASDGEPGRWPVEVLGRLLELAQGGELAELIRIARQWCAALPSTDA